MCISNFYFHTVFILPAAWLIFIAVLLTNSSSRSAYRALSVSFSSNLCTVLPQRFFNVWRHLDHTHINITLHYITVMSDIYNMRREGCKKKTGLKTEFNLITRPFKVNCFGIMKSQWRTIYYHTVILILSLKFWMLRCQAVIIIHNQITSVTQKHRNLISMKCCQIDDKYAVNVTYSFM